MKYVLIFLMSFVVAFSSLGVKTMSMEIKPSGSTGPAPTAMIQPTPNLTISKAKLEGTLEERRNLVRIELEQYGLTQGEIGTFLRLAMEESTFNSSAKNPNSGASGLFQIMAETTWPWHGCSGYIFNYKDNTKCAIIIYKRAGNFSAWVTY